jgi:hypothetical protein
MVSSLAFVEKSGVHTVKTAKDIVPIMKLSELLAFNKKGGLEPCCVNIDSHVGRAMSSGFLLWWPPALGVGSFCT